MNTVIGVIVGTRTDETVTFIFCRALGKACASGPQSLDSHLIDPCGGSADFNIRLRIRRNGSMNTRRNILGGSLVVLALALSPVHGQDKAAEIRIGTQKGGYFPGGATAPHAGGRFQVARH